MQGVRIPAEMLADIDRWRDAQPDPKPNKAEAIRRLIELGLRYADLSK
jgi:hypothetical protein